jgi:hypothetical protein
MRSASFYLNDFLLFFLILVVFFTGISWLFQPEISGMITFGVFVLTTLNGLFTNNLRKLLRPGERNCAVFVPKLWVLWVLFAGGGHQLQAQTCNCKEYIYLNEPGIGSVLKFEVGSGVSLTEVSGANGAGHWYPGAGVSELPSPHGLGTDLNGNLYIGASGGNSAIRKFNCDGVISPVGPSTINNPGTNQNLFSIGNTLYVNTEGGPTAYNTCTGAQIGQACLNGAAGNLWGLSYNPQTEMVYASQRGGVTKVWAFTRAQLEASVANGTCINPLIVQGANAVLSPGENALPNVTGGIFGVVGDNAGNIYVVKGSFDGGGTDSYLLKFNAAGQFIAQTPPSNSTSGPYGVAIGIVWSEATNKLYVSNFTDIPVIDCISVFDAGTMTYLGTGAANPGLPVNNQAKAIAIIKECCPGSLPSTFSKSVCGALGAKFYLNQEAFSACDGIVCGSSWVPQGTPAGMTFDPCDNSVTLTGTGCATFSLNLGAVTSTGCAAQSSTFSICSSVAPIISNPSGSQSVCEGSSGSDITVNSSSNAANSIRFVRFTTDQMAFAVPTTAEAANIYAGTPVATVTPTGGAAPYTATLTTAAAGWTGLAPGTYYVYAIANPDLGDPCRPVQEIVVTIVDKPEVTVSAGALCAGSSIDLSSLVTGNSPAGTLSFHTTFAGANAGTNPLINSVVTPLANTTYYVRSAVNATCFSVGTLQVTVNNLPALAANNGQICTGNSLNLATLVTNGGGGTLSYFTTLVNAQNNINALASPVVAPASATNYFIRSTSAAGCYTIRNVVVSLAAANCGAIQVTGPN